MSCNVCCNSSHNLRECPFCSYVFCNRCMETYILTQQSLDVQCMACKIVYSYTTLTQLLTKTFIKTRLVRHRKQQLFNREETLIPQTMEAAYMLKDIFDLEDQAKAADAIMRQAQKHIPRRALRRVQQNININDNSRYDSIASILNTEYERLYFDNYFKHIDCIRRISELNRKLDNNEFKTLKKCPECNEGYLNDDNICRSCDAVVCNKCLISITGISDHRCNADTVNSIQYIHNNTKQCPKCSSFIAKKDGCSQMFCINCNICFDWETLNIIDKNVHNPHYFHNLQERNMVNPLIFNEEPCAMPPNEYANVYNILVASLKPNVDMTFIYKIIQIYSKITYHKIRLENKQYSAVNYHRALRKARMMYILKRCTLQKYMNDIYDLESLYNGENRIYEILVTYRNIFNRMCYKIFDRLKIYQSSTISNLFANNTISNRVLFLCNEQIKYMNQCIEDTKKEFHVLNIKPYLIKEVA